MNLYQVRTNVVYKKLKAKRNLTGFSQTPENEFYNWKDDIGTMEIRDFAEAADSAKVVKFRKIGEIWDPYEPNCIFSILLCLQVGIQFSEKLKRQKTSKHKRK